MRFGDVVNEDEAQMILLPALAAFVLSQALTAAPHSFSLIGVGRFAVLADIASRSSGPDGVRMRALQVSEEAMQIGSARYIGGWSWWQFDCQARTADRLDFASLKDDLSEGPITPEHQPPYAISPGGDAAELFAVACEGLTPPLEATTVQEAVALAHRAMGD